MTPALAREMLSVFRGSNLPVSAFARQHDIPKSRVSYWQHRIAALERVSEALQAKVAQPSFAKVVVKADPLLHAPAPQPMQTLEATLPSGSRVVIHGNWDALSIHCWLAAIEAKS